MADRLTQLQICLDQLVEQFNATVNYVNSNSEPALLDDEPNSIINIAANAPLPGQQQPQSQQKQSPDSQLQQSANGSGKQTATNSNHVSVAAQADNEANFENTLNELATDIILKSRQITMLIDSLPGIGVSPASQLKIIDGLTQELRDIEQERIRKIQEKDKLLKWCESLITEVATGIAESRR
ncbi:mediator of RNA polymerase II transcription subunit 21 [Scheffersomyces amazonensis]|uniref:mediator of RNA polymerase II transcription subunit 21 n=1 Tax=Scheffersomyces amazonensis TaxID=1078765 RepID=UPI00315DDE8D